MIRILIAVALAALRIAGHKSAMFQAAAHLFVGGLFAVGYRDYRRDWASESGSKAALFNIWIAIALSVVEVACALWFHFRNAL